ncbi:unnamed protein product [Cylicocyclus nassatus]|uniref:Uncharacterized protein n=1 Tax=Cylicocyclus nassatus TaxID=53992 RepID=A0AA36GQG6_CYLNA|nr:unnamed protein product [Cylicocyclus nassatus]
MVPGDILRVKPEAIVKSVVPPVTALTDKVTWKMEAFQCADRLLDDILVLFLIGLDLRPNGNIGENGEFRTAPISMYYMIGRDNSENRETLHRYETLEDEFGNEFEEPHLSKRCVLMRGIAPSVPVSVNGTVPVLGGVNKTYDHMFTNASNGLYGSPSGGGTASAIIASADAENVYNTMNASFTISDLRTALALQHFQEDIQGTYKWTSFLQRGVLSSSEVLQTVETNEGSLGDIGGHLSGYGSGGSYNTNNVSDDKTSMSEIVKRFYNNEPIPEDMQTKNYEYGNEVTALDDGNTFDPLTREVSAPDGSVIRVDLSAPDILSQIPITPNLDYVDPMLGYNTERQWAWDYVDGVHHVIDFKDGCKIKLMPIEKITDDFDDVEEKLDEIYCKKVSYL